MVRHGNLWMILLLATTSFVTLLLGSQLDLNQARHIQAYGGYWICLTALAFFGWSFLQHYSLPKIELRILLQRHWIGIGLAFLATWMAWIHEPNVFRVFNDESSHALIAQNISEKNLVASPSSGFYEGGSFATTDPEPVYRMYLFPSILGTLHKVFGYSHQQVFLLNSFLLFCLYIISYAIGLILTGNRKGGVTLIVFLLLAPLFPHVASSGSYDLWYVFLVAVFTCSLLEYKKAPNAGSLQFSVATGVLLSLSRSEGGLYLIALSVLFFSSIRQHLKPKGITILTACSPLFMISPMAGRVINENLGERITQLYMNAPHGLFHLDYLLPNMAEIFKWLFQTNPDELNSLPVAVGALVSISIIVITIARRNWLDRTEATHAFVLFVLLGVVLIQIILVSCMYWRPTEISAVRFFLPLFFMGSVWTAFVIPKLIRNLPAKFQDKVWIGSLTAGLAGYWLFVLPVSIRAEATHKSTVGTDVRAIVNYAHSQQNENNLFVFRSSSPFLAKSIPAISTGQLNLSPWKAPALVQEELVDQLYFIETKQLNPYTFKWEAIQPSESLSSKFKLEEVEDWKNHVDVITRVYKVTGIKQREDSITYTSLNEVPIEFPDLTQSTYFDYVRSIRF